MRTVRGRAIIKSLCRSHKLPNGDVSWYRVNNELHKLGLFNWRQYI